ncbi:MAG: FAD/NAD(P)-binding protein [Phycisphaerales bacterium]|nr:FAD/NAD(P)-binding protein [Phycisphaerales bacterium]MCB9854366.1 FAD/NAD(P)-binding protein [Phycisphaerales bacterium]MCB9863567.1 FAD/NAD(P)-binding protein [Phycisphaerales bacterium]
MLATELQVDSPLDVYRPRPARVIDVERLTPLENRFRLEWPDGRSLGHAPGQFVQVSMLGVGECPISICSSPTRSEYFELTVRRVGAVTSAIHQIEKGDLIGIRGPLGRGFDIERFVGRDIVIVAGGCALAPARSLIQYIMDERPRFGEFHLLYGARSPEELLFRDEIVTWERDESVSCHVTVDRAAGSWKGNVGVVTTLFGRLPKFDKPNTRAVVIGPPVMFKFVVMELLARGIPQKQIYCSLERRMKCGIGKCGHCQVNHLYACQDGPVFNLAELTNVREAIE